MNIDSRHLVIDGVRTHVEISGNGPALILVHGLGGPLMWQRIVQPLSERFQVIVIDMPGFGSSDSPVRPYSTDDYARSILECMAQLRYPAFYLCGISYGGQIAAMAASRSSKNLKKLILIASTGLMEQPFLLRNHVVWSMAKSVIKHSFLRSESFICRSGKRSFYRIQHRPSDLCSQFFAQLHGNGHLDAWLESLHNTFDGKDRFHAALSSIAIPTLVLWGDRDTVVSPEYADEFAAAIKGSEIKRYKECGHSVPLEVPEELCCDIIEFCT